MSAHVDLATWWGRKSSDQALFSLTLVSIAMLLLLVWIHGFKGTDNTFEEFPKRICFSLASSFPNDKVESLVYPAYRTAGALDEAVALFTEWLISNVAEREEKLLQAQTEGKGSWADREQAKVVLLAHSMGGLVAADTILGLADTYAQTGIPPWPRITGMIAYDSPMLGLNPALFSNTAQQYIDHATTAHQVVSSLTGVGLGSLWASNPDKNSKSKEETEVISAPRGGGQEIGSSSGGGGGGGGGGWINTKTMGALGGTLAAAAAAGVAWHQRGTISNLGVMSYRHVTDHLEFVGALWKGEELKKRLDRIVAAGQLDEHSRAGFHCYYTTLPKERGKDARTFITLPKNKAVLKRFEANQNSAAGNEVDAHVSMFSVKNDGGHALALNTVSKVCEFV